MLSRPVPLLALLALGCPKAQNSPEPVEPTPTLAELTARGLRPVESAPPRSSAPLLLTGATVLTATGARLEPGWVAFRDGTITALGAGEAPADYADWPRVELPGRTITPGIIDTHSHLGVYPSPDARAHGDGNEATDPTTPGVWAEHSFWPDDPGIERAVAGGITTLQALPGSANLVGGRGVVLHLRPTKGSRAMRFEGAPETVKMACGENPKRVYGNEQKRAPSTRMGNIRGQREAFMAAELYRDQWRRYERAAARWQQNPEGDSPVAPARDLDMETLVEVLDGRALPQVHCYRADDMLTFLQIADEFGFSVRSFHHALEAYKLRDVLAQKDIGVSTWADWWGFKLEAYDGVMANAALVHEAGARAIIHSDSAEGIQRLNQEAAKALRAGQEVGIDIDEEDALRWITLNAAWALGIDQQVGSLEPGKRADLVVWNGSPFSVYSRAETVYIDGDPIWSLAAQAPPWSDYMLGQELLP